MDKSSDKDQRARQAAEAERRSKESGAHEADETKDRGDEHLVEDEDRSMQSLKRDDR
ncbi:hypothetical protein OG896_39550 [Streptomyces sp. NBC_00669]|uniref:hypothetical protein n=1 Tax=unclassified Streptomyces TaxID=2593676 RepID=UPI002E2ED995|nr:hypothetical protein [Streptomyces sp. NBC_00669]